MVPSGQSSLDGVARLLHRLLPLFVCAQKAIKRECGELLALGTMLVLMNRRL